MSRRTILVAGELEVHIVPSVGGSIARFDRTAGGRRQPLFRGIDGHPVSALEAGCFPLVPFCNRIRGGEFSCRGAAVRLSPNMPPDPSPLHGQGWLGAWELIGVGEGGAAMRFFHQADEWPWEYEVVQQVALDAAGLTVTLTCRNLSDREMPCGLGFHPYYPCDPATRLQVKVGSAFVVDENVLPVAQEPAIGRYDLADRAICGQQLDNGFGEWSGEASIDWPGEAAALRMSSPDCRFFQVFSPPTGGYFAAEPVQNANAALNEAEREWKELGIELLEPGKARQMSARFEVVPR